VSSPQGSITNRTIFLRITRALCGGRLPLGSVTSPRVDCVLSSSCIYQKRPPISPYHGSSSAGSDIQLNNAVLLNAERPRNLDCGMYSFPNMLLPLHQELTALLGACNSNVFDLGCDAYRTDTLPGRRYTLLALICTTINLYRRSFYPSVEFLVRLSRPHGAALYPPYPRPWPFEFA
jgi:hypothetical protein